MGRLQRKKGQQAKNKKKKSVGKGLPQYDLGEARIIPDIVGKQRPNLTTTSRTALVKKKSSFLHEVLSFFKESKLELKKVVWPTRKQTLGSTLVVIVIVSLVALFLGLVDMGLSSVIRMLLG